jgi:phosphatidylglycerol:prolipoprotein diacylglycerol transferase
MYPILFEYKLITIGSYGLLLGTAFYLGFLFAEREFKINGLDPDIAYKLLIAIIPSAIIGAKLFHIIDNFDEFLMAPGEMLLSGAGLSVYGGFLLSFVVAIIIIKKEKQNILKIFDIASPSMALGYGIGRLGCHVAGDGCYGITSDSIFAVAYPGGIVPVSATVYPTPLFESTLSFIFFFILLQLRTKELKTGTLFFIYIALNGTARFIIEFIRLNPVTGFGLTQAQLVGILFIITGIGGLALLKRQGLKS